MKKIIMMVLVLGALSITACSDKETITLYEDEQVIAGDEISSQTSEPVVPVYSDNTAENCEDSRPFVVFVTGRVKKPGVYELNEGSRIIDAVSMAGGYEDDACIEALNLAALVNDADMIYVPSINDEAQSEAIATQNTSTQNGGSGKSDKVNINKATKEELMTLPGIGESKADKIINYRNENGPFSATEGIMQISGIKDGLYNKIKDRISVK